MEILREGSTGSGVVKLQEHLLKPGFTPGPADGEFGPGTASTVAFQKGEGSRADGVPARDSVVPLGSFQGNG
jgi:peptidoglycan hydrolase-like protein with peptidoglycan-binding domain